MNNPYTILGINQNATNEEIEKARKEQLKLKCSIDQNAKDENGEYLSDVINKAADNLLNKERRKEIDERLNNANLPAIYSSSQLPQQVILTSINNELIEKQNKIVLKKSFFDKKVECKRLFIGVLSNNSCVFFIERTDDDFYLNEYFTDKNVTHSFKGYNRPWSFSKFFDVDGLLAFAYPAYQVIPNELIKNGKISENTLRSMLPILQEVLINNNDELDRLFKEEQEKVKVRKE